MSANLDKLSQVAQWQQMIKCATDMDAWGQPVEAIAEYQKIIRALNNAMTVDFHDSAAAFTDDEKRILSKVCTCMDLRRGGLERPGSIHAISLIDLKHIHSELPSIIRGRPNQFPVDVTAAEAYVYNQSLTDSLTPPVARADPEVVDDDEDRNTRQARGNLMPRPVPVEGKTAVTIRIEKIGLKDARQLIEPQINIYVKDRVGSDLAPCQTTPLASLTSGDYVIFNTDVYIQRHLEALPEGFAIVFEFVHYKPKKRFVSTKCWSFVERDEIREGPCCVEIYQKPVDPKRKRVRLLTSKPMYLYLRISLN